MSPEQAHEELLGATGNFRPSSVCTVCNKPRPLGFQGCRKEECPWKATTSTT